MKREYLNFFSIFFLFLEESTFIRSRMITTLEFCTFMYFFSSTYTQTHMSQHVHEINLTTEVILLRRSFGLYTFHIVGYITSPQEEDLVPHALPSSSNLIREKKVLHDQSLPYVSLFNATRNPLSYFLQKKQSILIRSTLALFITNIYV